MESLPNWLRIDIALKSLCVLVPKFHLQSHNEACHSAFSFNFFKGGARTDGEGVERNWDELNGQGPSMSEMLPGARWDTLDDCAGWVNWRKTVGLGEHPCSCSVVDISFVAMFLGNLLLKQLLIATPKAQMSCRDFNQLDKSLHTENSAEHLAMQTALAAWEADHKQPDPYRLLKSSM